VWNGRKCSGNQKTQSYLFAKDKGWTMSKAKAWFANHEKQGVFQGAG